MKRLFIAILLVAGCAAAQTTTISTAPGCCKDCNLPNVPRCKAEQPGPGNRPPINLDDKCDFLAKDGYNVPCLPSQTLPPVSELDPQCGTALHDDGRCHSSTFIMGRDCTLRRIKGGWDLTCSWKSKGAKRRTRKAKANAKADSGS